MTKRHPSPPATSSKPKTAHRVAPQQLPPVNPQLRHRMIAEAAYYIAEKRNFNGGDPVSDWLEAEAFIDQVLLAAKGKRRLALQFLSTAGMERVAAMLVDEESN